MLNPASPDPTFVSLLLDFVEGDGHQPVSGLYGQFCEWMEEMGFDGVEIEINSSKIREAAGQTL